MNRWRQRRRSASDSSRARLEVSTTTGARRARSVPSSGTRDLEVGEQLEQKRFELLVGLVDLVDQQERLCAATEIARKQRTLEQVLARKQMLRDAPPSAGP